MFVGVVALGAVFVCVNVAMPVVLVVVMMAVIVIVAVRRRLSLADLSGLFERVCQLQNSPVIVVLADDLQANGQAGARKAARHRG